MSVYPSIHHCDQHISLQDFVERIVMQRGSWYSHPLVQRNSMMIGMLILAHQRMRSVLMHRKLGGKPKNPTYKTGPDDKEYSFVFFSTFEVLDLPIKGPMEDAGVTKLYEPSPTPCLYVAPAANMAGRVPLIPLFLAGNSTPTIPHMFSKRKDSGFPYGCADSAAADGRRGSNVYEVNPWLWQFGRGKPRLGGLSVEQTFERQVAANEASKERAAENRRRRKADKA